MLFSPSVKLELAALLAAAAIPAVGHAQWAGSGAGGTGTDFNDASNWTGTTVSGTFTNNTTDATLNLSAATTTLNGLNFNWATANNLTINGNGTGANEVINLQGDILLSKVAGTSTVTIGSDVTLDYGTFTTTRNITYASTGGTSSLIINGLITGSTTNGSAIRINYSTNGNPVVYFNNTGNTFDAPLYIQGPLYYTSIGNVGGGASALGAPTTAAKGLISIGSGQLNYIGNTDQSSDRNIAIVATTATIQNASSNATKLTLSGAIAGRAGATLILGASNAGSVLEIQGQITGATATDIQITNNAGTVKITGTNNTNTGATYLYNGTLAVTKLANGGVNSSIGAAASDAAKLDLRNNTTLRYIGDFDSSTDRLFKITGTSTIEASGAGAVSFTNETGTILNQNAGTLILAGSNTGNNTFAPILTNNSGYALALTKKGTGTWILNGSGANTNTGVTTVSEGILALNKSAGVDAIAGNVTINGGTLRLDQNNQIKNTSGITISSGTFNLNNKTETVNAVTNTGGTLTAGSGASAGATLYTGNFTQGSGAHLALQVGRTSAGNDTVGDVSSHISVTGSVSVGGDLLLEQILGTGHTFAENDVLYLIINDGLDAIVGKFDTINGVSNGAGGWTEGSTLSFASKTWKLTYTANYETGSTTLGNDLALVAVPEPQTWAMMVGGFGALFGAQLRRRRLMK